MERWWNNQLTSAERDELKAHLDECADCRQELEGSQALWEMMGELPVPEPTADLQAAFNIMLKSFKATVGATKNTGLGGIGSFWQIFRVQPWLATAFSLLLITGGIGLGYVIKRPAPAVSDSQQLTALSGQVHEMREMMMLSLLQNPSASERMRGVSYTSDIKNVNPSMADALLATLNNDPNVNVRLTTLEALTHFANDPKVREGLVESILQQESPLVQSALADVMLKLQERRSIQSFKKLLQQKDLNGLVRTKIQQTISQII